MDVEAGTKVSACPGVDLCPDGRAAPNSILCRVCDGGAIAFRAKRASGIYPATFPNKYEGSVSPQPYL
jgi:hypothetical protein